MAARDRECEGLLHEVLSFKVRHPDATSRQVANHFEPILGRPLTEEWARKRLWEARAEFADLLLVEVKASLAQPTPEAVEEEIIELDLHRYCRKKLREWQPNAGSERVE
jgi:hypothetical protein